MEANEIVIDFVPESTSFVYRIFKWNTQYTYEYKLKWLILQNFRHHKLSYIYKLSL